MDLEAAWLIAIAVSVPIGAVVGFALQLHQLKNLQLANAKLQLQLTEVRKRLDEAENVIVRATPAEIERFGSGIVTRDLRFSQSKVGDNSTLPQKPPLSHRLRESLINAVIVGVSLTVIAYLAFDLFRVGRWLFRHIASLG
jgi:hypothetical protein